MAHYHRLNEHKWEKYPKFSNEKWNFYLYNEAKYHSNVIDLCCRTCSVSGYLYFPSFCQFFFFSIYLFFFINFIFLSLKKKKKKKKKKNKQKKKKKKKKKSKPRDSFTFATKKKSDLDTPAYMTMTWLCPYHVSTIKMVAKSNEVNVETNISSIIK